MPEMNWGRKETIIWPPHQPIYTYGAIFLALVAAGFFVYLRFAIALNPLERYYPANVHQDLHRAQCSLIGKVPGPTGFRCQRKGVVCVE